MTTALALVPHQAPKAPVQAAAPSLTQLALATPSAPALKPPVTDDAGILQPPEDLKVVIDRTASWVARNGAGFEQKVKDNQKDNMQFSFLRAGNPYYAYYQQKVREIRRVEVIAEVGDQESVAAAVEIKMHVKRALLGELPAEGEDIKTTKAIPKKKFEIKKENLEPPPREEWIIEKPNISALQDDIIKLSAQFVARNGRAFQTGLFEREHKNPQFGFLQSFHPLHNYYKKLVADYTKCLLPDTKTIEKYPLISKDKQAIVDKVMRKVQWEKAQKKTEEEKRREEEAERNAMSLIDWHDFAVVQTIEWEDDEEEGEEEAATSTTTTASATTVAAQKADGAPAKDAPAPAPPAAPKVSKNVPLPPNLEPSDAHEDVDMDMGEDEFEPEPKRTDLPIRPGFNPRGSAASSTVTDLRYVTPSGQQITPSEAELTMKIELSNIKLIEQRKQEALNERESNLAEGIDISKNLKNFASHRQDIFGDGEGLPEDTKKPTSDKLTWDGHSSSIQRVAMEAIGTSAQHKSLHEKMMESIEPAIGPKFTGSRPGSVTMTRPPEPSTRPMSMPARPPGYPPSMYPSGPMRPPAPFPIPMTPHFTRLPQPLMNPIPMPSDEPPNKRQKIKDNNDEITKKLIGEREFLEAHPGPVNIVVKVPNQPSSSLQNTPNAKWPSHLNGQTYRVQVLISDTVKILKQKLAELLGMPANKQKLRAEGLGYLKDAKTMAFYNATDNIEVELGIKERGGRKK